LWLLGQGSWFVFGVAGLQGRLLCQMQRFDWCRWSAMIFCGNVGFEQHPAVDRQPPSVEGLDLVGDCDVGVQVRVAGPLSRWMNAAATRTLTCRMPCGPVRVNRACFSMNAKASCTAA